jgi:hypothetical protein
VAAEQPQRIALVVERVGVVGLERDRALEALQRLVIALECGERRAAVAVRFGKALLPPDRLVEVRQRRASSWRFMASSTLP